MGRIVSRYGESLERVCHPNAARNRGAEHAPNGLWGLIVTSRRGILDSLIAMVPQAVRILAGLVTSVLLARGLGATGLGQFTLVLSISEVITALSDLGVRQTAVRYAARHLAAGDREGQYAVLRWAFRQRLALAALVGAGVLAAAPLLAVDFWHDAALVPLIRLSLLLSLGAAVAAAPMAYFQAQQRFAVNTAVSVGQVLITFLGVLLLAVLRRWSVEWVLLANILAVGLGALAFIALVPRRALLAGDDLRGKGSLWRRLWHAGRLKPGPAGAAAAARENTSPDTFARLMLLSTLLAMVASKAGIWLMSALLPPAQVGLYSVALRLSLPLEMALVGLTTALWPRASALTAPGEVAALLRRALRLAVPLAAAGLAYAALAPLCIPWAFGAAYAPAVPVAQALAAAGALALVGHPCGWRAIALA
jgi:O-antigen/teichoic acid export membrane protein